MQLFLGKGAGKFVFKDGENTNVSQGRSQKKWEN